ncbi:NYN domain-containing protein [bacterium]|nr:NYN domain-containing protein [bacterium]
MNLIIDGYNLLFKMFKNEEFTKGRELVIEKIQAFSALRKDITVFLYFDGNEKNEKEEMSGNIHLIYTKKGKSADIEMVKKIGENPESSILVSSDRAVFSKATNKGCAVLFCEEFIGILKAKLEDSEFKYFFRNKKNESKRKEFIKWLLR